MAPKKEVHIVSVAPFDMQGRLLMGLRNDVGRWTLPGGHLEGNEHPIVGALRELHEETGLRPGAGGLEYLGSFPLDHGGNKLRIHSFRATGVTGAPTGSKDPDQECQRWDWHDVTQGLPEHVEKNLYNQQDVTLQALGFQQGPMRKFEVPPSLDLRMPALARLLKTETRTGDREKAKDIVNLTSLVLRGIQARTGNGMDPAELAAHEAGYQQLHEMNLPEHSAILATGDREDVKLALRHPALSRLDREILLQRALGSEEILGSNLWRRDVLEPLAGAWDEDQRIEMIRRLAGRVHVLEHLLGPGDITDAERAAILEGVEDNTDPETSTAEERTEAHRKAHARAHWAMGVLRPPFIPEEGYPGFGYDKLTPDQLDRLNDHLTAGSWHANEVLKHPNLSEATVKKEMLRLYRQRELRSEPNIMLSVEQATMAILTNPKANVDDVVDYVRSNLRAGVSGRDATNSIEDLSPEVIDRVAPDILHNAAKTTTNWVPLLEKHYVSARTGRPLPKDAKEALLHLDATASRRFGGTLRAFRNLWLDTPFASIADRQRILRDAKHPVDGDDAISMPQWGDEKFKDEMRAWHQELMRSSDVYDVEAARQSDRPVPPEYLKKIDTELAAGPAQDLDPSAGYSKRLDQLFDSDRPFAALDPGAADLLAKHAPTNEHAAGWLSFAAQGGNRWSDGVESRHLDALLKDLSPHPKRVAWRQAASHSPAITGQQLFDYLRRPDTEAVHGEVTLRARGDKLDRQQVASLIDDPREPIAVGAAARLHPDDLSSYIRRPGHQQRPAVLEAAIKKNPNFHIGHLQEMKDTAVPGSPVFTPSWMMDKLIEREDATPDMLRFWYHSRTPASPSSSVLRVLDHPNTPPDVLKDIERRVRHTPVEDEEDKRREAEEGVLPGTTLKPGSLELLVYRSLATRSIMQAKILRHPNIDLDHLQEMKAAYDADHPGLATEGAERYLHPAVAQHHPDLVYKKQVTLKPGTERFREIRDLIAERQPTTLEMHPRELPPGDWSAGRAPNGNISAKLLQQHIDRKSGQTYNLSVGKWEGAQRHNSLPSKVLQVNITTKHRQDLRQLGLRPTFDRMLEASLDSNHPVTPHTIGWVRYTGDRKTGFFIDEIQSDFGGANGRTYVQKVRAEAQKKAAHDLLPPLVAAKQVQEAVEAAEERWPEKDERAINQVIFGGRPTNQVLHEAFLQHLRDTGAEGAPVHIHSVASKAPISLGIDGSGGVPAHMKETYGEQPRKMGYKPVRYGDIPATSHMIPDLTDHGEADGEGESPTHLIPDSDVPAHLPGAIINGTKVRKSDDDEGLRAAFRDADGKVTITGSVHDLFQLPGGLDTDVTTIESGYVDDEDGKFYTREQLKHPKPLEKKERSFETNASMWLLSKMAVKPEDLSPVKRYTDADAGASMVDDSQETKAHPGHLEPLVSAFKTHIIDSPKVVKRGKTGTATSSNSTGKVVYDLKGVDLGEMGTDHRFMVKPYHEKIVPRMRAWHHAPTQGWAEMTNQALYHSAGIGHLHQEVHVARLPTVKDDPALIVHMHPGVQSIVTQRLLHLNATSPEQKEDARRIALMDFLSNNLDRHGTNLMVDPANNHLLAIDHSRSFQYKTADKRGAPKNIHAPVDDALKNYLGGPSRIARGPNEPDEMPNGGGIGMAIPEVDTHSFEVPPEIAALEEKARRGEIPWTEPNRMRRELENRHRMDQKAQWTDAWKPAFDWWQQHSEAIKHTFRKRLALIKDSDLRNHMWRNFQARQKVLDEYARDGHDNYGQFDWHHHTVPIFRLGTKLHENDEFSDWFDKDV